MFFKKGRKGQPRIAGKVSAVDVQQKLGGGGGGAWWLVGDAARGGKGPDSCEPSPGRGWVSM